MGTRPLASYDFLNYRLVSDPQISPDGAHVLFVTRQVGAANRYETSIWYVSLKDKDARPYTSGYRDVMPRWSPQGHRIAFVRSDSQCQSQLFVMQADGGEATPLVYFPEGEITDFRWSPDGEFLAVSFCELSEEWTMAAKANRQRLGLSDPPVVIENLWYRCDGKGYFNKQRSALYSVNARTGAATRIYGEDVTGDFSFDFSPDSKHIVLATHRNPNALLEPWHRELLLYDLSARSYRKLEGVPACTKLRVRWSPDGSRIAFGGYLGHERAHCPKNVELFVADARAGETRSVTAAHDLCFHGRILGDGTGALVHEPNYEWSADSQSLWASVTKEGARHLVRVDLADDSVNFLTQGFHHDELGGRSVDGATWTFTRGTATTLPEVYAGSIVDGQFVYEKLTKQNDELFAGLQLSKPEMLWAKNGDGTPIQTWILRPAVVAEGPSAAILDIHGGPHSSFGAAFVHDHQVLAAQGYTVVYSNPRGSKGYGEAFSSAIRERWGQKDWEDIQAVIAHMKTLSAIDPDRLGVMGSSYGGYMANWTTSHITVFKAAVTDRGVCNLVSFFGTTDYVRPPETGWEQATPWHHADKLWDQSPLKFAEQVVTPTLILHPQGDLRVPIEQAEQWFTALQLRNIPSRFVRYLGNTSHLMTRSGPPDLRLDRLEQIIMWFGEYL